LSSPNIRPVQADIEPHSSATSGNGFGIVRSIHTSGIETKVKSKPKSTSAATTTGLSDEDDSAERESVLQSQRNEADLEWGGFIQLSLTSFELLS
jgi:hypothetical protein